MATVDSLDIKISAEANTANAALETLSKKLDRVSASLSGVNSRGLATLGAGVNKLSNAMNNFANNTKTADFSRLSRNLGTISDIDTGKFSDLASKMSQLSSAFNSFGKVSESAQQIGDFAKNIAKLGNKSVQTAITNIPLLAVAMKDLMQTLSTAPIVSQNTIQMTNALANLAAQGGRAGAASRTMVNGLNNTSNAMNNAKKSSMSLAVAFGKFYASYFLVIRGIKKLWGSIESSFDYLEVLNYFDAAFGQVAANADLSSFEKMGYESADAYYGSFAKRAEEVTRKMSGFTIGENGLLQSTGAVSLGLDPSQLMNYQAMFGQMSSSMGVSSETALKLSQALTEIGADLASVKNLEFETVWNDMASGLAGMSRTLDKYGVNIRNVNLQQKLMELGIDANIQALNQNDKALLRAIILLENTKYAWGDLADTINQPANQLRLIQANFENLGRTIGNLFLPIVKTVLPYVNALVIAVQRLFSWLGNLIGIDISDISTSIGGADMGDILDQTDDLSSGLGDAKKQADKLNKSLRQFDELKVINTKQDNGGAGIGIGIQGDLLDAAFEDAFTKYQQEWDKAFGKLENKAQEIADKIEKAFDPLKKIIQDFAIGDFFQAGQDTSALVTGIFDFFADAIDKVNWFGIGQKIGEFLEGIDWIKVLSSIGNLIWQAIKASIEVWVGSFTAAPIETGILTALGLMKFTKFGNEVRPKIVSAIMNTKLITSLTGAWTSLGGLGGILTTDLATIMGAGTATEIGMTIGTGIIGGIIAAFAGFEIGKEIGKWIFPEDAEWYDNFKWTGEGGFFDIISSDWETSLDALDQMITDATNNKFIQFLNGDIAGLMGNKHKTWNETKKEIADAFSWIKEEISREWDVAMKNIDTISNWYENSVKPWLSREKWLELGGNIGYGLTQKWGEFSKWWEKSGAKTWFETIVKPVFDANNWNFSGITDGLSQAWKNAVAAIKNIWNKFVEWINEKLDFSWSPVSVMGKEIVPGGNIKLGKVGKISGYANGGFPEDGWFRASHGEIMGQFDNGQSVVANNYQITEGIADAVYPAVYNAVSSAIRNNSGAGGDITIQLNLDGEVVYRNVIKRTQDQSRRTYRGRLVLADEVF